MVKKSGLGKGLSVLIPVTKESSNPEDRYAEIDIGLLDPNPDQPRHQFHEERLRELSDSIKNNGVIQPIIVTARKDRYVVIAGERRWRAAKLAGFEKMPAIVRRVEEGQMLSLALLENIQRQELNPIEEALAYRRLLDTKSYTHERLAEHLGKNRASISNTVRLLRLPDPIKNLIQDSRLSFGHARCLVTVEEPKRVLHLAEQCVAKQWSVRDLERKIQQERPNHQQRGRLKKDEAILALEKRLANELEGKVSIAGDAKKGKIVLNYGSEEGFKRIIETFLGKDFFGNKEHG